MYFIALVLPSPADQSIRSFKEWMKDRFGCVKALRSPAHITLVPPFWLPENREAVLLTLFHDFTAGTGMLPVWLDGFSHFGKRVLFIEVKQQDVLNKLQGQVMKHFTCGLPGVVKTEKRPFHPHVTIAARDMRPAVFAQAWEHFSKLPFSEEVFLRSIHILKLFPEGWQVIAEKKL